MSNDVRKHGHAVVIGGSMAGLVNARVLTDLFEKVTVLDRDERPQGPEPRKGVPQGQHLHVLLEAGKRVLEELFPGLTQLQVLHMNQGLESFLRPGTALPVLAYGAKSLFVPLAERANVDRMPVA